jgi:hypothetical protein
MAVKWARRMTWSNQYDGICHSLIPTPQMPDRPAERERLRGRDYHLGADAHWRPTLKTTADATTVDGEWGKFDLHLRVTTECDMRAALSMYAYQL